MLPPLKTAPTSPSVPQRSVWQTQWPSEAHTLAFAQRLSTCNALAHAILALHGNLGAGKTTLVRYLLRALGVSGRIKSPTYAVVEPYSVAPCPWLTDGLSLGQALQIWHFDFYRFTDPREWEDAGFRDLFSAPGLKLVEWPEHAGACMPMADLDIEIEQIDLDMSQPSPPLSESTRHVQLTAHTPAGERLLQAASI